MEDLLQQLSNWMSTHEIVAGSGDAQATATAVAALLLLAWVGDWVAKRILLATASRFVRRSGVDWDDALLDRGVFGHLAHLVPGAIVHALAPAAFALHPQIAGGVRTGAWIYMVLVVLLALNALLDAAHDIYERYPLSQRVHIRAFVQVAKLLIFLAGAIYIVAQIMGKSPLVLFSGLGAFTAILILVFRDAILGLVAGIYMMSTHLVRRGDWIEMQQYGADGDVIDVALMSVRVQNWDKTIVSVPSYAMISESFRNWRGMTDAGGRRIKRAVYVDVNSVRLLDAELRERFARMHLLKPYLEERLEQVRQYNEEHGLNPEEEPVNGRRLTNLGCFRAYLARYLDEHPRVHDDMTQMVRQLPPGEHGLPLEIYCFANTTEWGEYEGIQADIFDHVLAVMRRFELRPFQEPSGADLRSLRGEG